MGVGVSLDPPSFTHLCIYLSMYLSYFVEGDSDTIIRAKCTAFQYMYL